MAYAAADDLLPEGAEDGAQVRLVLEVAEAVLALEEAEKADGRRRHRDVREQDERPPVLPHDARAQLLDRELIDERSTGASSTRAAPPLRFGRRAAGGLREAHHGGRASNRPAHAARHFGADQTPAHEAHQHDDAPEGDGRQRDDDNVGVVVVRRVEARGADHKEVQHFEHLTTAAEGEPRSEHHWWGHSKVSRGLSVDQPPARTS